MNGRQEILNSLAITLAVCPGYISGTEYKGPFDRDAIAFRIISETASRVIKRGQRKAIGEALTVYRDVQKHQ